LREQAENVLRSWFGSRWLSRYEREVELLTNLTYFGLTTGRAIQTLGEEYTGIWSDPARLKLRRLYLALILLPTLPTYLHARLGPWLSSRSPFAKRVLQTAVHTVEVLCELNLAVFYLHGRYYDVARRVLGVPHVSSVLENPHSRPPSYSLLGVLILIRLVYRLMAFIREARKAMASSNGASQSTSTANNINEMYIGDKSVSEILNAQESDSAPTEESEQLTVLDIASISPQVRASRICTLCLEERRDTCATECGHLFDWDCIYSWGREKSECPLCRQALDLTKLLPIYNL